MNLSKFGLLFVIFVDVFGQSLILPIINTLVMDPGTDFLPPATSKATRHFDFGLVPQRGLCLQTFRQHWPQERHPDLPGRLAGGIRSDHLGSGR
jgi:hypothetical protein